MRCRQPKPHVGLDLVGLNPVTLKVENTEIVLRGSIALFGSFGIPLDRFLQIPFYAVTYQIFCSQFELRISLARFA